MIELFIHYSSLIRRQDQVSLILDKLLCCVVLRVSTLCTKNKSSLSNNKESSTQSIVLYNSKSRKIKKIQDLIDKKIDFFFFNHTAKPANKFVIDKHYTKIISDVYQCVILTIKIELCALLNLKQFLLKFFVKLKICKFMCLKKTVMVLLTLGHSHNACSKWYNLLHIMSTCSSYIIRQQIRINVQWFEQIAFKSFEKLR